MHSGDSACSIPPQTISADALATIREWTPRLAKALKVVGLINIQYVVQDNQVRLCLLNRCQPCPFERSSRHVCSETRLFCRVSPLQTIPQDRLPRSSYCPSFASQKPTQTRPPCSTHPITRHLGVAAATP